MKARRGIVYALVVIAGCASPLTIAEPRDGGEPGVGAFGDAGALEAGEGGDSGTLADPPDDAPSDG